MSGVRSTPRRMHAFPVKPGMDDNPGPGLRQLRRLPDRSERMLSASVIAVGGSRVLSVHVQFPCILAGHLPELKQLPVRQYGAQIPAHSFSLLCLHSNLAAASFISVRIGRCCGHTSSHCPHSTHADAFPLPFVTAL